MSTKAEKEADRQDALEFLKEKLQPGGTVYGQFIWANSTGTTRIYVFYLIEDQSLIGITHRTSLVTGARYSTSGVRANGIDVGGDDGTRVVQRLAKNLFGDESALGYRRFL